jgi:hypothetical protein
MACIFPNATSRGRYFIPAIGPDDDVGGTDKGQRAPDSRGHLLGRLHLILREVNDAQDDFLAPKLREDRAVEIRLRGFNRDLPTAALGELGQKRVAGGPDMAVPACMVRQSERCPRPRRIGR